MNLSEVQSGMVQLGCESLEPTLSFFLNELGFRVKAIYPADDPRTAIVTGHSMTVQLTAGVPNTASRLALLCGNPAAVANGALQLEAPNGTVIRLLPADPEMKLPPTAQSFVLSRMDGATHWSVGRAGLRYRDLLPERHGGAFIASHIRILEGGVVPDYEHYHKIRFQMIFCRKGWVRVAYEGQGEPLLMREGDCFLQPPLIRHRVMESSAGAEVVEIASPASHITIADHDMVLPSPHRLPPDHRFGGQRFVHHVSEGAPWGSWRMQGFSCQDTTIGNATDGLAGVRIIQRNHDPLESGIAWQHATEFCCFFILQGRVDLTRPGQRIALQIDDSVTLPGGESYQFENASPDLMMLEVTLPDEFEVTRTDAL